MRWKSSIISQTTHKRVVKKFLLFPRRLNTNEWRWLEYATILERTSKWYDGCIYVYFWSEYNFLD